MIDDVTTLTNTAVSFKVGKKEVFLKNDWIAKAFHQEGVVFDNETRRFRYSE